MSIYDFKAKTIEGKEISLSEFEGKVVLIVNTASKCGFTKQYEGLEKLYQKYKDQGFVVLGFPCNQFFGQEPENEEKIQSFCKLNYGVSFPMFAKIEVNGENTHPLYKYLKANSIAKDLDMSHEIGSKLLSILQEKLPQNLQKNNIKWNFTKFLVDKKGEIVARFEPTYEPLSLSNIIEELI